MNRRAMFNVWCCGSLFAALPFTIFPDWPASCAPACRKPKDSCDLSVEVHPLTLHKRGHIQNICVQVFSGIYNRV